MAERLLTRREFLKRSALVGVALALAGCRVLPEQRKSNTPARLQGSEGQATPTPTTPSTPESGRNEVTEIAEILKMDLKSLHPDYPKTHEEAAALLSTNSQYLIKPENLVRVPDLDGTWRGWWMIEMFPLNPGISYNQNLNCHVDANGNPVFNPLEIFDTSRGPKYLADIRLNDSFAAVFARRGGATRDKLPPHTHYFTGTEGTIVKAIEQATIIPVPKEICGENWSLGANTVAWRQAVKEFRDNPHARDGFVENGKRRFLNVLWFNPERDQWQQLDGRLIAELARQGNPLDVIDHLPAGWPISNKEVAQLIGGNPQQWVFNPITGEWYFEAWPLKKEVRFTFAHFSEQGTPLVGASQADARTTEIFDFRQPPANMVDKMNAPGNLPAVLFVRVGRMPKNRDLWDHSWYIWGNTQVVLEEPVIEQATLMPVGNACIPVSVSGGTEQLARAKQLAEQQPDPNVTASYWNGNKFVSVSK